MISYDQRVQIAKQKLSDADCIVIGGGAGLSDAAGLKYAGQRFHTHFAPFIERYGFKDLYTSSFYPFNSSEERWAYWAKHISFIRYEVGATRLYQHLLSLVQGRNYHIITTNVDYQFLKAGFFADKVFDVQGDYGRFQCARRCHDTLYDNEAQIAEMMKHMKDLRIPTELIPKCPVCGCELDVYVHKDQHFVMGDEWHKKEKRYSDFLQQHAGQNIVYLELGVGFNTPGIIRIPFEQFTFANPNAMIIRANRDYPSGPKENERHTISFAEDMARLVQDVQTTRSSATAS